MIDDEMVEDLEMKVTKELGMGIRTGVQGCHAVDSPPSKAVPPNCPRQNNQSPGPNIAAIPGPPCCRRSPLLPTVPLAADCGLFAIAFATALAYGEQPGHCLFDQNKVMEAISAEVSAGGGDDTTLIEEESA